MHPEGPSKVKIGSITDGNIVPVNKWVEEQK